MNLFASFKTLIAFYQLVFKFNVYYFRLTRYVEHFIVLVIVNITIDEMHYALISRVIKYKSHHYVPFREKLHLF